jgi:hypothetical protein
MSAIKLATPLEDAQARASLITPLPDTNVIEVVKSRRDGISVAKNESPWFGSHR